MNPSPAELTGQIAALDDGRAITALRLVLERQGQPLDPIDLRDTQNHLEQAPPPPQPPATSPAPPCTTSPPGRPPKTSSSTPSPPPPRPHSATPSPSPSAPWSSTPSGRAGRGAAGDDHELLNDFAEALPGPGLPWP